MLERKGSWYTLFWYKITRVDYLYQFGDLNLSAVETQNCCYVHTSTSC